MSFFENKKPPQSLAECMETDKTADALLQYSISLDKGALPWMLLTVVVGTLKTIFEGIAASESSINDDAVVEIVLSTAVTWIIIAAIVFGSIKFLALLIRSLASLVQNSKVAAATAVYQCTSNSSSANLITQENAHLLLQRAHAFLQEKEWLKADEYANRYLDLDPTCPEVYAIQLLASIQVSSVDDLPACDFFFDTTPRYEALMALPDNPWKTQISQAASAVRRRQEPILYQSATETFDGINKDFNSRINTDFNSQIVSIENEPELIVRLEQARDIFRSIEGYQDAEEYVTKCTALISSLENRYKDRLIAAKRRRWIGVAVSIAVIFGILLFTWIIPTTQYDHAQECMDNGDYLTARHTFDKLGDYKNSEKLKWDAQYQWALNNLDPRDYQVCQYVQELVDIKYEGAEALEKQLYAWKITLDYFNTNENNTKTILDSIPTSADYLHFGVTLSGGRSGEKINVYHKTTWPYSSTIKSDWNWENCSDGHPLGCMWSEGYSSNYTGTLGVSFYVEGTDECIGSISIPVKD